MSVYEITLTIIAGIAALGAVGIAAIVAIISEKGMKIKSSLEVELKKKEPPESNPTASTHR